MKAIYYRIRLDVSKADTQSEIIVKQNDTHSRIVRANLSNGSEPYIIADGVTAVVRGKKPSGTILYNTCDIEGNFIVFEITNQMIAEPGTVECEITLNDSDGATLTSPSFLLFVDEKVYSDSEIESTNEFTELQKLEAAEFSRAAAETAREESETIRQQNEQARVAAEASRVSAETARVAAETARKTKWNNPTATANSLAAGTVATADVVLNADGVAFTFGIPKGDKGEPGYGFKILGYYASVSELESAVTEPEAGDAYGVGGSAPYDVYVYDGAAGAWVNNGPLQGAKGDKGTGVASAEVNDAGELVLTLTDGTETNAGDVVQKSQSDWDQNDPAAADYVKNRTHYVTTSWEETFAEQTVTFTAYEDLGYSDNELGGGVPFENMGDVIRVTFDGSAYLFRCDNALTYTPLQEDSPVLVYAAWNDSFTWGLKGGLELAANTHTVAVELQTKTYKKLDIEYLPLKTVTKTIYDSDWEDNAATINVSGVTAGNAVIVAPAPESMEAWSESGVRCTGQAADSLTFECDAEPASYIWVNIMIVG